MWSKTGYLFILCLTNSLATKPALLLTPLINSNKIQEARKLSEVNPALFLNISSHSGFLTIDERYNSNTFFWYFPVVGKPLETTPWIVWLQGGPGATSIAGLFDEIGPFQFDGYQLKLREWAWSQKYTMLFIDNPVGAGYSFTNSQDGFITNMDTCATHLYKALRQFLMLFPELRKAPLFLAGESYAGHYLPAFALKIKEQDSSIGNVDVNLQGVMIGNPIFNRESIVDHTSVFQHWGLIDSQGAQAVKHLQDDYISAIKDKVPKKAYDLRNQLLDKLSEISSQNQIFNVLEDDIDVQLQNFKHYIERPEVKEALHAGSIKFTFSNGTVHTKLLPDFLFDVSPTVTKLLESCRILIYCGQLDLTTPCILNAQARRKNWRWAHRDSFLQAPRTPWWYNNTIAGYVKSGGYLTEVLVRGAGHLAPMDKPAEVLNLISLFIKGYDVPMPPNYVVDAEYTPEYNPLVSSPAKLIVKENGGVSAGMIVSLLLNILFIILTALAVVYYLRWRRRNAAFFYNNMEQTAVAESVLALT